MYKVAFRGKAAKQLQQLSPPYFRRVAEHIDRLAENPRPAGAKRLTDQPGYSLRVGIYRILYDIDDEARVVVIYRVKHRREAYR